MKITIKVAKPRNNLVTLAKFRRAGAHKADDPARRARREQKHQLQQLLSGRKRTEDGDD